MASTAAELLGDLPSTSGGAADAVQGGGGPGSEGRKVSTSDIQLVQNLIERCLQLYMSQREVVLTLQQQAKIEPGFTQLVWQKLEEQNPDFFRAYYTRLKLKDQIVLFNHLLEQQVQMVQKMRTGWLQPLPGMVPRPGMPLPGTTATVGGPGAANAGLPEPNFGVGQSGGAGSEHIGLPLFTNTGLAMPASSLAVGASQAEPVGDLSDALQNLPISSVDLHSGFPALSSPTRGGLGDPGDLLAFPRNFSLGDLERIGELGHAGDPTDSDTAALGALLQQDATADLAFPSLQDKQPV